MSSVFIYVVDRDFGFAPNPFHGYCTLATCKPRIRKAAQTDDWVLGMGGSSLKATGRCIFAMKVTHATTFDDYWENRIYIDKKPVRNGSRKMMVGDNIYHRNSNSGEWQQADSHHSSPGGTVNLDNLMRDTSTDRVLISDHFLYFGKAAKSVPQGILDAVGYKNPRDYRRFDIITAQPLLAWLEPFLGKGINRLFDDPFSFSQSGRRYAGQGRKII